MRLIVITRMQKGLLGHRIESKYTAIGYGCLVLDEPPPPPILIFLLTG